MNITWLSELGKCLDFICSAFQIRRLRIEIEKLQWLHQQELSEMKHNLGENDISLSRRHA